MAALIKKVTSGATSGLDDFDISEISDLVEKITMGATEGIGKLKDANVIDNTKFEDMVSSSTGGAVEQLCMLKILMDEAPFNNH